jgi:LysM repeat protein
MRGYRLFIVICSVLFVLASFRPISAQGGGTTHVVAPGENLYRIALRYGVTVDALAAANHIANTAEIFAGQVLIIPAPGSPAPTAAPANPTTPPNQPNAPSSNPATDNGYYTVVPGDTLNRISRQFNVSTQALMTANSLPNPDYLQVGQRLAIPGLVSQVAPAAVVAPAAPASSSDQAAAPGTARTHIVAPGEGLTAIARLYNISYAAIAAYNNIPNPNLIYVGMVLKIPSEDYNPAAGPNPELIPASPDSAGKFILVVLHEQRVYIYQNGQMIRTVLVSTGVPAFPTVTGTYRIYLKYQAQTMYGPGYYLPGVPWVLYFYQGYSFHGTYWHSNWGRPMSHGCVNMPTPEAQWLYNFAEVGTPVQVRW